MKGEGRTRAPNWMGVLGQPQASLFCTEAEKRNKSHFFPSVISNQRRGKLTRERKSSFTVPNFDISSGPKYESGSVLSVTQSFSETSIKSKGNPWEN